MEPDLQVLPAQRLWLNRVIIFNRFVFRILPDVPTLAESGYTGFDVQSWFGLAAPAGTPRAVIEQVNAALNKVLAQPEVRTRLQELAATPDGGTPDKMRQFAAAEIKRWREVVKESGASAE